MASRKPLFLRNRQPGNPQLACIFFLVQTESLRFVPQLDRPTACMGLHSAWFVAGHGSGCMETSRANEAWGGMPRIPTSVKSPTFKSFKQVIAMSGSLVSCGGSLAGRAAPREQRRKGGSAPVCGRLAALFAVFFFRPSVSSPNDKRLVTHLRRISGRGHGGERGRKMTARPGVGRVSAPAVRGLRAGPGRPGGAMGIGHQGLSSRCSSSPRWRCVEM